MSELSLLLKHKQARHIEKKIIKLIIYLKLSSLFTLSRKNSNGLGPAILAATLPGPIHRLEMQI